MRKLEITLTEEQYQHIQEEIKYGGRTMLEEETFGGYEITLHVGVPNIYTYIEMSYINKIDLGEVEWSFSKNFQSLKN
ncbi:hypothetical protein APR41_05270 [Salegentibacter salinarum]|uniref:Uncharacterized protein n=1 Tax=Salegentibacter salinarum TaxID=447422 RepID=A0A2N0TSA2_9FLAO|nr:MULTISPECIES: hypothetical protein [Salegentibacter]MBZ9631602.1 hypothetical protein [Salegentibacter lacus]PKD17622.1 hypothetical protein APR41_05270 [Salegentibacter salinarum]SKB49846.1 hypothetical protein SAMN05660903_01079 [Salegentibacter salinarum]